MFPAHRNYLIMKSWKCSDVYWTKLALVGLLTQKVVFDQCGDVCCWYLSHDDARSTHFVVIIKLRSTKWDADMLWWYLLCKSKWNLQILKWTGHYYASISVFQHKSCCSNITIQHKHTSHFKYRCILGKICTPVEKPSKNAESSFLSLQACQRDCLGYFIPLCHVLRAVAK